MAKAKTILGVLCIFVPAAPPAPAAPPRATLAWHTVILDGSGKIVSWLPQATAYNDVMRKQWDWLIGSPVDANGRQPWYYYYGFDPVTRQGAGGNNTLGEKNPSFVDSALKYFAYSGDARVVDLAHEMLDFHLAQGTTPATWNWSSVPYASETSNVVPYNGWGGGGGDFVIECDKVGEIGKAYLDLYKYTGETKFRDAALNCANALAGHVRTGSATQSPWPWRVRAETGQVVVDYTSNIAGCIELFDGLIRMNLGNVTSYQSARNMAWTWLMNFPMVNNVWTNYFGDDPNNPGDLSNLDQVSPMEIARYILENPSSDPNWQTNVPRLISFVESEFGTTDNDGYPGEEYGARVISEQKIFFYKVSSHTVRYAHANALLGELAGDAAARDKAFRSFNWTTYMCRNDGLTKTGPNEGSVGWWYEDSYFDHIRHLMGGIGAIPDWAPPQTDHILRSTSVVRSVTYVPGQVSYTTFDNAATEVLRLSFQPGSVTAGGVSLPLRTDLSAEGYTLQALPGGDYVVRVRHDSSGTIVIASGGSALPVVTVQATDPTGSEPGADTGAFTVSRTGATTAALTVTYTVAGTASADADYTALSGSVTIPAGQSSATVTVLPLDDTLTEPSETVIVTLSSSASHIAGSPSSGTVTILDDESPPPSVTIWPSTATPAIVEDTDTNSVQLGVKFRSDVDGQITGIRFYKGPNNTGAHVGNLWTRTGTNLGSLTFTGETASGWQQANFAAPILIAANTTYVASYFCPNGRYSASVGYFATSGYDNPPLHALQSGVDGPNGVYVYGASSAFPTDAFNSTNYWVDVVFSAGSAPTPTVTVATTDGAASEPGTDTGTFTVTRTGSTGGALTVSFTGGGTAASGADYSPLGASVSIPSGAASATITVTPIDDTSVEGSETVVVTLSASGSYGVGTPGSATVTIADNDTAGWGDADGDGLPDAWEMSHFGNLSQTASGDPDADGFANAQELAAGTNPTLADTDGDGMPDGWEAQFGLNPTNPGDASGDLDGDGYTNGQEYQGGSDPSNAFSIPAGGGGGGGNGDGGCGATGIEGLLSLGFLVALRRRRRRRALGR